MREHKKKQISKVNYKTTAITSFIVNAAGVGLYYRDIVAIWQVQIEGDYWKKRKGKDF